MICRSRMSCRTWKSSTTLRLGDWVPKNICSKAIGLTIFIVKRSMNASSKNGTSAKIWTKPNGNRLITGFRSENLGTKKVRCTSMGSRFHTRRSRKKHCGIVSHQLLSKDVYQVLFNRSVTVQYPRANSIISKPQAQRLQKGLSSARHLHSLILCMSDWRIFHGSSSRTLLMPAVILYLGFEISINY
jgi:hypothetical protein